MSDSEPTMDDLFAAGAMGAIANPYPLYRKLRDESPVYEIGNPAGALRDGSSPRFVMVTRYDDVRRVPETTRSSRAPSTTARSGW